MPAQQTTETPNDSTPAAEIRENTFDENGQTIDDGSGADEADPIAEAAKAEALAATAAASAKKYRIGDREFATQDEALTYAQSQVTTLETETQVADAYRQGIRDAMANPQGGAQNVTLPIEPPKPEIDPQEMYTNPEQFLQKFATKIKNDTIGELSQTQNLKAQSDQIWNEFTYRHPELADFRTEVEQYVQSDTQAVRSIIATKGRPSSYDYIATKIKSRFESYATALKPKRELPNGGGGASPGGGNQTVTPPAPAKKALSFSQQVASIRKKR